MPSVSAAADEVGLDACLPAGIFCGGEGGGTPTANDSEGEQSGGEWGVAIELRRRMSAAATGSEAAVLVGR